jgi:hypothetical protein
MGISSIFLMVIKYMTVDEFANGNNDCRGDISQLKS